MLESQQHWPSAVMTHKAVNDLYKFARKLERERDEAIKMLEEYSLNVSDDDLKILTDSNRMGAISMVSAKREIRRREIVNRIKKQES